MSGINSGILHNAYPLTPEHIKELEKDVFNSNITYVYLDENSKLSFMMPNGIDGIKDLAWDNGYELSTDDTGFTKKVYAKTGFKTFELKQVLAKEDIDDSWGEPEQLEGTGAEYYTLAPTALSFRSTEPLNEFKEVKVNGQTVDPANYTLEEGSTIVKLSIDYLKTLEKGNYEVAVVSENKTVKGEFTVAAPQLNEHGFYYNQPYTADVAYLGGKSVFFLREDGSMDFMVLDNNYTEVCSYTVVNGNITVTAASGTFTASANEDGIYCNELATTFVLGDTSVAADEDYIYIYKEDLGGYEVKAIDKTKAEYGAIKTGINGIDTIKLANYMFTSLSNGVGNKNMVIAPKIPDTVTIIGEGAFVDCTNLTKVVVPESVITIEQYAFSDCSYLESINIPDSVTSIGVYAFRDCTGLTSVTIGNSVTSIGNGVFYYCSGLTSITIPDSVTSIGDRAFEGCSGLASVTIGNSVTSIGRYAFYSCSSLTSVTIPDSVVRIHSCAFNGCSSLTEITFNGTTTQWANISRGTNWNLNVPATHVQCSDGQVAL